jgi:glutathione S-transferase
MKPLLLHGHASSPNAIKVSITLQYLELPYEIKIWELGDDPHLGVRGEDFAMVSPNGRVPALADPNTDVLVWESAAIINYLKRRYDRSNILGPRGSSFQAQADLDQWEYLLVTTVAPMTGQLVHFR